MIYISSLAFLGKSPEEIIAIAKDNNLALEFSSGMPYRKDMEEVYLTAGIEKMLHNYFPAPETPFVLNLASANQEIREKSIAHCLNGLNLAAQTGNSFFSAHAGFCIDPDPNELGKKISYSASFDREKHKTFFLNSVQIILAEAERLGLNFLIENNVIASFNMLESINPLLCCESEEIAWLFKEINNDRLGLLLDTAHLKVSCETLRLDLLKEVKDIATFIKAIHHSDNEGLKDSNEPITAAYWFLPLLKDFTKIPHVIEVKNIDLEKIKEQVKLLQQYGH